MPARERKRPGPASMLQPAPEAPSIGAATQSAARTPKPSTRHSGAAERNSGDDLVFLSGRVPRAVRSRMKQKAAAEDRPLAELITEACERYLDD